MNFVLIPYSNLCLKVGESRGSLWQLQEFSPKGLANMDNFTFFYAVPWPPPASTSAVGRIYQNWEFSSADLSVKCANQLLILRVSWMIRNNYANGLDQGKPNRNVIPGSSFGKTVASAKEL